MVQVWSLSDEQLSRYGLLENYTASGSGTVTGMGTGTTGVTTIAFCTSSSRAKKQVFSWPSSNKRIQNIQKQNCPVLKGAQVISLNFVKKFVKFCKGTTPLHKPTTSPHWETIDNCIAGFFLNHIKTYPFRFKLFARLGVNIFPKILNYTYNRKAPI